MYVPLTHLVGTLGIESWSFEEGIYNGIDSKISQFLAVQAELSQSERQAV